MAASKSFRFVYIPADSTQPMEELSQELVPGQEVECLTHRLQQHFRRAGEAGALANPARLAHAPLRQTSAGSSAVTKDIRKQMLQQHVRGGDGSPAPCLTSRRR